MTKGQWDISGMVASEHQRVRIAGRVHADGRARELREADGQVLIGARPIDAPAGAVAVRRVAELQAAELEGAVEVVNGRVAVPGRLARPQRVHAAAGHTATAAASASSSGLAQLGGRD